MASLSSNQVDKIYDLLVDHKITLESLQIDLLDHLCCMVEQKMDNGLDFGKSLTLSIQELVSKTFLKSRRPPFIY